MVKKLLDDWDIKLMMGIMVVAITGLCYMSSSIVNAVNSNESITCMK